MFGQQYSLQTSLLLLLLLLLPGTAFYRAESAQGRDLAVLAAAVYRQQHGRLRVLDVMSGSGMRGARYLTQVSCLVCYVVTTWPACHDSR
jgi:hypothetical protein